MMLEKLRNHSAPERADGLVRVACLQDLAPGELTRRVAKGQTIVLTLITHNTQVGAREGTHDVVAFSAICPHSLGNLTQGWVDKDEVECPVHYYRYNLRTGECTFPAGGPRLHLYPVTIEGDDVYVKVVQPRWMDVSES